MNGIDNYGVYTQRMRMSMWDKAFFIDKIPGTRLVIDFGCADGSLTAFLHGLFPAMRFIGYDIDPEMIRRANSRSAEGSAYFSDLDRLLSQVRAWGISPSETAVLFSSVLHEVFHYSMDQRPIRALLNAVQPGYIMVRDMMFSRSGPEKAPAALTDRVRQVLPAWQISDFEAAFGSICEMQNLIHLLLKFRYVENWSRECPENYFSFHEADMRALLDPSGRYRTLLHLRYTLPWCRLDAEKALGMSLGEDFTTHFALVMTRRHPAG